jgi:hypothetical protein
MICPLVYGIEPTRIDMFPKTVVCSLLAIALIAFCTQAQGKQVAIAQGDKFSVVLTDEKCNLDVKLPYRAIWKEPGKTFEGCFTIHQGIVVFFFDDKSLALVSAQAFVPLESM